MNRGNGAQAGGNQAAPQGAVTAAPAAQAAPVAGAPIGAPSVDTNSEAYGEDIPF